MFLSLSIKNSFLDKDLYLEFDEGLNILSGKNNSGKSTTVEMLNFSLFGSVALRSSVANYPKTFEVEVVAKFGTSVYKIYRNSKTADLFSLDIETNKYTLVCTGTTPVNTFIKELLSYDYKVFSLTNYCKQHDLLNLTSCTPKALVTLIEVVSGLEDSYRLMHELKELKKRYKVEVKTLVDFERFTNKKVTFEENAEFEELLKTDPEILGNFKDVAINLYNSYTEYSGLLKDLKLRSFTNNSNLSLVSNLKFNYENKTEDELKLYKESLTKVKVELTHINNSLTSFSVPKDLYEDSFIAQQEDLLELNKKYKDYLVLKQKLEAHKIICPDCSHEFYSGMTFDSTLEETFKVAPEEPQITSKTIKEQQRWIATKDSYDVLVSSRERLLEDLKVLSNEYLLSKVDEDLKLHSRVNSYATLKASFDSELKVFFNSHEYLNKYLELLEDSSLINVVLKSAEESLDLLVENLHKDYTEAVQLKDSLASYVSQKLAYTREKEALSEFDESLEKSETNEVLSGLLYQVLLDTKKEIQQLSLPVLNSVASNILSDITGGERNKVQITEEFKIEVDNVDVNVVEGSAQVITNLSLRIALLNTFYKDNFLVCIFDEVDESLHEDRFEYMEECFNRLAESGYQIIAVSHKDYSSGNIINLNEVTS